MFCFNLRYLLVTLLLLVVEILIAAYVHDNFIRPYAGDFLVVILLYCFVKSFVKAPPLPVACGVLLFSFCIEALQYFQFLSWLGWQDYKLARIVLGSSFSPVDLLAYVLGTAMVLLIERITSKQKW